MKTTYLNKVLHRFINKEIKKYCPNIRITMSSDFIDKFWEGYRNSRNTYKPKPEDYITPYMAGKEYKLDHRLIKKLADDDVVRSNINGVVKQDVEEIAKFLEYFTIAGARDFIKETVIQGNRKYLIEDYRKTSSGKTIPEYKMELMAKLHHNFFGKYFDFTPKENVDIPDKIQNIIDNKQK